MKRMLIGGGVVVLLGAFLAGYWPQHAQVTRLENEVSTLRNRTADLEARNRVAALLGDLLNLSDAVRRKDYGQAQQLSSPFFDRVRAETLSPVPSLAASMSSVLSARDAVTSDLARGDGNVAAPLREMELQLRSALGYPTGPS